MPVAKGGPPPARQAALVGLAAALGLLALLFLITRFDSLGGDGQTTDVELGQPVFSPGSATDIAAAIADSGPLLLPDAARGDRDVILQHLGEEPAEGWLAFAARPEGADRACFVEWQPDERRFVDSCDGTTYPEDGQGLEQFAVSVGSEGALTINLNPLGTLNPPGTN